MLITKVNKEFDVTSKYLSFKYINIRLLIPIWNELVVIVVIVDANVVAFVVLVVIFRKPLFLIEKFIFNHCK